MVDIQVKGAKPYMSESEFHELKQEAHSELNFREETIHKPKDLNQDQKKFLDATKKNSEQEFEGLTKDNIIPIGDKILVKVATAIKTKGNIYLPNGTVDPKSGHAIVEYCEIVAISPKIKKDFETTYPNVTTGWRCKFNVNLALQIAGGACLIEKDNTHTYQYYTLSVGQIDYVYPAPASPAIS